MCQSKITTERMAIHRNEFNHLIRNKQGVKTHAMTNHRHVWRDWGKEKLSKAKRRSTHKLL